MVVPSILRSLLPSGAAIVAVAVLAGCQIVDDPTSHSFPITFLNDTRHSIDLNLCLDPNCKHFGYSHRWKPAESAQENATTGSGITRWLVEDAATQRTLGCLPLQFTRKKSGLLVDISQRVPCPGNQPIAIQATHS
jgi:hypothetical protein